MGGRGESWGGQEGRVGMSEKKPENIQAKMLRAASWTEEDGYKAVTSWLRLSTAQSERVDLIAAQNEVIAIGARKAFGEVLRDADRERWMHLPFTGVDGLPKTGQTWVRKNSLTATIVVPPNTGLAIEALANAMQTGLQLPECILTEPKSFPSVGELKKRGIYYNLLSLNSAYPGHASLPFSRAASVFAPKTGLGNETLTKAMQTGLQLPECILTEPKSFPSFGELKKRGIY